MKFNLHFIFVDKEPQLAKNEEKLKIPKEICYINIDVKLFTSPGLWISPSMHPQKIAKYITNTY